MLCTDGAKGRVAEHARSKASGRNISKLHGGRR